MIISPILDNVTARVRGWRFVCGGNFTDVANMGFTSFAKLFVKCSDKQFGSYVLLFTDLSASSLLNYLHTISLRNATRIPPCRTAGIHLRGSDRLVPNRSVGAEFSFRTKLRNFGQIIWSCLIYPVQPVAPQQVRVRAPREQRAQLGIVVREIIFGNGTFVIPFAISRRYSSASVFFPYSQ